MGIGPNPMSPTRSAVTAGLPLVRVHRLTRTPIGMSASAAQRADGTAGATATTNTTAAAAGIVRCTARSVPSVPPSIRRSDADWLIRRNPVPNGDTAGTAQSNATTGSHLAGTTNAAAYTT